MKYPRLIRYLSALLSIVPLLVITWLALSGGIDQFSRSLTAGQLLQTSVQIICGILSLATIITFFIYREWAKSVQKIWAASLVFTAAISALVWGPPMPIIAIVFGVAAYLLAIGIIFMHRMFLKHGEY